ncbi:MAG: hypothetical protein A3J24_00880 [Deltaproteobacteria bacterium RIFCSPLOWO2_02_FULL_53_8]|nr:MAG: hypothetical protein A3J24_00880 [Deltaproteobacteria bacterium RIFCSPLOWO2_02_FULL_53_8]
MTLIEMLDNCIAAQPDKAAVICNGRAVSYVGLGRMVNRAANAMLDLGLQKGDRVGVMVPRGVDLVTGFLAAARAGGVAMPVNFELSAQSVRKVVKAAGPRFILVNSAFYGLLEEALAGISGITVIVSGECDTGCVKWDDLVRDGRPEPPDVGIKAHESVYLNYTSGSTGDSKGAITTHYNIYSNTVAAVEALGLTSDDVHLCMFAPFAHPHEIFARALYLGGTAVIVDSVYPKAIAEAISKHKVTCMMGLAPMYENLLDLVAHHKGYDLSSLRIPESGGMYTRPDLIDRFKERLGVSIIPVWGSTETTGIALANRPGKGQKQGSVGMPCRDYEVKIVGDDGAQLPVGAVGEMAFKGPAVVDGYFEDDGIKSRCFNDGWYYSGDLGKKDEEGNYYFVERKSGMMKVAGHKVYPTEIEIALLEHPAIKEVSVLSVHDRLRGEVPKAIIVTRDSGLTSREVLKYCKGKLANYKVPRIVEFRDALPKTGSGKINKKLLQLEHA